MVIISLYPSTVECSFHFLCLVHIYPFCYNFLCKLFYFPYKKPQGGNLCFLGYEDEQEYWSLAGLLHDVDFETYPDEHCKKAPELLAEIGAEDELIHSICSHGYGLCCDIEPIHEMEKVLFATDELTGLIGAAARMHPSKSVMDMEVSSLKKKFKDKKFAAGCSRDVIRQGSEMLGWELDILFERTIEAMKSCEASLAAMMEE